MARKRPVADSGSAPSRRDFLKATALTGAVVGIAACDGETTHLPGKQLECEDGGSNEDDGLFPDLDKSAIHWGFLVDLRRCTGCRACSVACKTENDVPLGRFRNGVVEHEDGDYPATKRNFVPWLCNHCAKAPCIKDCPVPPVKATLQFDSGDPVEYMARATYQRPDGLVLADPSRCVGCGQCVSLCPYNARFLNPNVAAGGDPADVGLTLDKAIGVASKCTRCIQRVSNGIVPACVNTCPAEARMIGNLNDSSSAIAKAIADAGDGAEKVLDSAGTASTTYYIGAASLDKSYNSGDEPRKEAGLQTNVPKLS